MVSHKIYCPIRSPNLRPAQLSTKVTPAENVIICLGKNVFWLFLLIWIVDRGYMSIPRCYDIPKKLLSNYDCKKISHGRVQPGFKHDMYVSLSSSETCFGDLTSQSSSSAEFFSNGSLPCGFPACRMDASTLKTVHG